MPYVAGFLRIISPRQRPVDPGWGVEGPADPILPLPPLEEPVDPDYGYPEDSIPGLPEVPEQGPVVPGRPGHPLPRPEVPVVRAIPLPEDAELPAGLPHEPGCICIVVDTRSNKKALGWLQGASALPDFAPEDAVEDLAEPGQLPEEGGEPAQPPLPGGHWVAVDADPEHACEAGDEASVAFAFVFEVSHSFGRRRRRRSLGG